MDLIKLKKTKMMNKYIPIIPMRDLTEVTFSESGNNDMIAIVDKLKRASKNGNNERSKYKITFATNNGQMKIDTTIWMVGDEYVLLKENLYMPITSIIDVN